MNLKKWLIENTESLASKKIAVTGTTGGLGRELCQYLAQLGASLILLDRNIKRSEAFREELVSKYPQISVKCITVDLESIESVKTVLTALKGEDIDVFIHNAGAYSIPRHKCLTGFDNVFQINFVSPYYIIKELLPQLKKREGRVVVVGSIAHNYSKTDPQDIDFSTRKKASLVYGNAKRYLMFSLCELSRRNPEVSFSITHPGITFTNITAHYPKLIFAIIKHPMKVIFMKPKKSALSILKGVFETASDFEWIGPRVFDVWGLPKKKRIKTAKKGESDCVFKTAEQIYENIKNN